MSIKKYFTRKPVKELIEDMKSSTLERTLGAFQLVLIGIGAIIGAGIFVLAGTAAGEHAGPAITVSFALGGLACAFAGLCYAELSSTIPISGGAYTFAYAAMGELVAWLIMGMMLLTYALGAASVASGWSGYMTSFLADYGLHVPPYLMHHTGFATTLSDGTVIYSWFDLPAVVITMLITAVVYRGAEAAAWVNTFIVAVKMTVLVLFIAIGMAFIDPENWKPFIPENSGTYGQFGPSGIVAGAAVVFLAFTGFDAVATTAQEAKNPQRDLPIGILGSLFICTIFYILISGVLTGIVKYTELGVAQPMAIAVDKMHMPWFSVLIKIGAVTGLTSVILVLIYGCVRVLYTVVHDGLLPSSLGVCHKKYRTPHLLTIVVGSVIAIMGSTLPLSNLVKLSNFGTLVTFATVCIATIYLRYKQPELIRGFYCPLMPWIPLAGVILFAQIIFALPTDIFIYAGVWISFLLLVYFAYSRNHSHLLKEIDAGMVKEIGEE